MPGVLRALRPAILVHATAPTLTLGLVLAVLAKLPGAGCSPPPAKSEPFVRAMVREARHPEIRWPDFPDFQDELERLYRRSSWRPIWFAGNLPKKSATGLIARLSGADSLGLDPADYEAPWLASKAAGFSLLRTPTPEEVARFDVGLSIAAARFVAALQRGRVRPRAAGVQLPVPSDSMAVETAVEALTEEERQKSILDGIQPRFRHYRLLKAALARYRSLARDSTLARIPALSGTVKPGARFPGALALRRLLEATGDMGPAARGQAERVQTYTPDLVEGVRRFQRRHGIVPNGVIDGMTAAELERPFADRARQIELTLERWRWLPASFPEPPIVVDIPAFKLAALRGPGDREEDALVMDVVVGDAYENRTPAFRDVMEYVIFRPFWEVPVSIVKEELIPKEREEPSSLERDGMVLVEGEGESAAVVPVTPEALERVGTDLRLRQLPGPGNALGRIKFVLPNAHNVYLHDTPAKGLFGRTRRDLSHGCIRVSDPVGLAAHVLRHQPGWTPEKIRAAMEGEDDKRVNLERPVPVYIVYATAVAVESGNVYFYSDIYGLDRELDALLRKGYPDRR
jgi:murein L,D-transpeptidase YcbB/YkuD